MTKHLLILSLSLWFSALCGQSVVSSGGQSGTSNQLHASATIGEAIIGNSTNGSEFANQGFQQPLQRDVTSVIEITSKEKIIITAGPIPTTDLLHVTIEKPINGVMVLTDLMGRKIQKTTIQKQNLTYTMDLTRLNPASYILLVISEEGTKNTSIPIIKI